MRKPPPTPSSAKVTALACPAESPITPIVIGDGGKVEYQGTPNPVVFGR
jgi:hypothetical protein